MWNIHLQELFHGSFTYLNEWDTYKFNIHAWSKEKKSINNGVYVKGVIVGENDFYGIIPHIYESEYNTSSSSERVVVFFCDWFDPSCEGTIVNPKYEMVDIQMNKKYLPFELYWTRCFDVSKSKWIAWRPCCRLCVSCVVWIC